MWARSQVHHLENELLGRTLDESAELLVEIETLGLDFDLVTKRTAFVAVDDSTIVHGHELAVRLLQPQELPRGVRYWGVVGRPDAHGVTVPGWGLLVADGKAGELVVAKVDSGGTAARAGLLRGYVVESVGGHRVHGVRHLRSLLGAVRSADVEIGYRNGAGESLRSLRLPVSTR